jgi:hypothetical protein
VVDSRAEEIADEPTQESADDSLAAPDAEVQTRGPLKYMPGTKAHKARKEAK